MRQLNVPSLHDVVIDVFSGLTRKYANELDMIKLRYKSAPVAFFDESVNRQGEDIDVSAVECVESGYGMGERHDCTGERHDCTGESPDCMIERHGELSIIVAHGSKEVREQ